MNKFHKKLHQNRILDPDFRILGRKEGFKHFFHQLLDQISTFFLKMFIDNDLIFHSKINCRKKFRKFIGI